MSATTTDGVQTGSESETATSTTTTEDEDATVSGACTASGRLRKRHHESPFMFLEIPFEDQKILFDAIRVQNLKKIKDIVTERSVSLKWRHFIHSPLGLACCLDQEEVANLLLKKIDENSKALRGELNYQDRKGWTPLMYAALNGNAKLVARLHKAGARVNCRDRLKWTPLAHACYNGHVDVVKYLLHVSKADVRLADEWNTTVLHCLAKQRDVDIFDEITTAAELVLQRDQSIVDSKTVHSRTALHEACKRHNPTLVGLLLNYGAKVNAKDDQDQTPVFYIFHGVPGAGRRMLDCLRLLLKVPDIRLNLRDSFLLTPIHLATLEGDVRAVNILVEAGADFKFPDRSKRWPIHYAARDQQLGILELLLKRDNGSQVNATSWSNISTPLTELLSHCAEVNCNQKLILRCVKVLLRHGADVSVPNAFLNTPIDLAAEARLWTVTRLLILAGALYNAEILQGCVERMEASIERSETAVAAAVPNDDDDEEEEQRADGRSDAGFSLSRDRTISQRTDDSAATTGGSDDNVMDDDDVRGSGSDDDDDDDISREFRDLLVSPTPEYERDTAGFEWCRDFLRSRPLSLMNIARIQIRRAMAERVVSLVRPEIAPEAARNILPLPQPIIDFVLLKDEMENLFY